MYFWYSCFGVAACTIAMCCCLSSPFPNSMVCSLQSKDIIHLTPQYSLGFSYHSRSSLSSMHTYKAGLNAHVRFLLLLLYDWNYWTYRSAKLFESFRPCKLLDFRYLIMWLSLLYTFRLRGLCQFFFFESELQGTGPCYCLFSVDETYSLV
jgi:hypothetical protein